MTLDSRQSIASLHQGTNSGDKRTVVPEASRDSTVLPAEDRTSSMKMSGQKSNAFMMPLSTRRFRTSGIPSLFSRIMRSRARVARRAWLFTADYLFLKSFVKRKFSAENSATFYLTLSLGLSILFIVNTFYPDPNSGNSEDSEGRHKALPLREKCKMRGKFGGRIQGFAYGKMQKK